MRCKPGVKLSAQEGEILSRRMPVDKPIAFMAGLARIPPSHSSLAGLGFAVDTEHILYRKVPLACGFLHERAAMNGYASAAQSSQPLSNHRRKSVARLTRTY